MVVKCDFYVSNVAMYEEKGTPTIEPVLVLDASSQKEVKELINNAYQEYNHKIIDIKHYRNASVPVKALGEDLVHAITEQLKFLKINVAYTVSNDTADGYEEGESNEI